MGFPRRRILEWVAFPSPGVLVGPGIKPVSPVLAGGFFTTSHLGYLHLMSKESSLRTCLGVTSSVTACEGSRFPLLCPHHSPVTWSPLVWDLHQLPRDLDLAAPSPHPKYLGGHIDLQTYSWFHLKRRLVIPGLLKGLKKLKSAKNRVSA